MAHHPRMPLTDNGLELLTPDQCQDLLARSGVGRVGVTVAALPAIFPVNYALLGDDIVFLTGEGTKLRAAADRAVVAFQVDGFDLERQVVQAGRCGDECAAALLEQRDQQFSVTGQEYPALAGVSSLFEDLQAENPLVERLRPIQV